MRVKVADQGFVAWKIGKFYGTIIIPTMSYDEGYV
jgi:hypothetical protein